MSCLLLQLRCRQSRSKEESLDHDYYDDYDYYDYDVINNKIIMIIEYRLLLSSSLRSQKQNMNTCGECS